MSLISQQYSVNICNSSAIYQIYHQFSRKRTAVISDFAGTSEIYHQYSSNINIIGNLTAVSAIQQPLH
jgi:hypothetical protein